MPAAKILALVAGIAVIIAINWYFFAPSVPRQPKQPGAPSEPSED